MLKGGQKTGDRIAAEIVDRLGNNVIVRCFACENVFIVGQPPIYKKARPCPHCKQTAAIANLFDNGVSIWVNEDGRSNKESA